MYIDFSNSSLYNQYIPNVCKDVRRCHETNIRKKQWSGSLTLHNGFFLKKAMNRLRFRISQTIWEDLQRVQSIITLSPRRRSLTPSVTGCSLRTIPLKPSAGVRI